MDGGTFDRLTRLFAGAVSRRTGLAAALAGLAAGSSGLAEARQRGKDARAAEPREDDLDDETLDIEGPCGKGRKNRCKKHKDCCTKFCKKIKGKGKRCRCIKKGRKCKKAQKCCKGLVCQGGRCGPKAPPAPACGAADAACTADAGCCEGLTCQDGRCSAEPPCVPIVCDTCTYTTIQAAIDAKEGLADHLIGIAAGDYVEDLSISGDVTLRGCGAVTVKNATAGRRTIQLPTSDPGTYPVVEIRSITVTTDTVSPNFGGGIGGAMDSNGVDDGGFANLILSGRTIVTGARTNYRGGGVCLSTYAMLTMQDDAEVSENAANSHGGGFSLDSYGKVFVGDRAVVRNNTSNSQGGGIYVYYGAIELSGSASVTGNTAGSGGGGIANVTDDFAVESQLGMPLLTMKDQSSVFNNTCWTMQSSDSTTTFLGGGGISLSGACDDTVSAPFTNQQCPRIVMSGSASVTGNSAGRSGAGTFGGGINAGGVDLIMSDSASITGNFAYASLNGASGSQVMLYYNSSFERMPVVTETGSATVGDQCRVFDGGPDVMTTCSA